VRSYTVKTAALAISGVFCLKRGLADVGALFLLAG